MQTSHSKQNMTFNPAAIGMTASAKQYQASACAKAIVVGEHAVVYGAKAVAIPLPSHRMNAVLSQVGLNTYTQTGDSESPSLVVGGKRVPDHVAAVITDAFEALELEPFALEIKGDVSLPIGAGFGSSASLCVVTLRAIAATTGITLDEPTLATLANRLERRFHGTPSGLDTAVVAYERPLLFCKGEKPEVIMPCRESTWRFFLIDSALRSSTLAMINKAKPFFCAPSGSERIIRFTKLSEQAAQGLKTGEHALVADAMQAACALLAEAGVVNEPLKDIIAGCQRAGALAAKPTGAGGGGAILALMAPHVDASEQRRQLANALPGRQIFEVGL